MGETMSDRNDSVPPLIWWVAGFMCGFGLLTALIGPIHSDFQVLSKFSNKKLCQRNERILTCYKVIKLRDRWEK